MDRSSPNVSVPTLVLACVAAVHGVVLALRLPARLVVEDELQFARMAYALGAFVLAQGLALPAWGAFSDRIGRQKVILYSLVATAISALLGLGPFIGWRLPQQFVFAVFNGLGMASLPLALAYSFSLIKDGPRHLTLGKVSAGFFAGAAVMVVVRYSLFSLPREGIAVFSAIVLLLAAAAAAALVGYLLPEARAASVSFTGMNAMHGLWHGFGESNRAVFARWWKLFLALSGLACGLIMMTLLGLADLTGPSAPKGISFREIAPLVVCFGSGAVASLATAWILLAHPSSARVLMMAAAGASLLAALPVLLLPAHGIFILFVAALFCGLAMAAGLMTGVIHFAMAARTRSAGAETGAVVAVWLVALLAGVWLALMTFKDNHQTPAQLAVACGVFALVAAFMATRKSS